MNTKADTKKDTSMENYFVVASQKQSQPTVVSSHSDSSLAQLFFRRKQLGTHDNYSSTVT